MVEHQRLVRGGELRDYRVLVDSGNTFFDISVNTDQIGMGFEADFSKNESNMSILATSRKSHTMFLLRSILRGICFKHLSNLTSINGNISEILTCI